MPKKLKKKKRERENNSLSYFFWERFSLLISDLKMSALLLHFNMALAHKLRAIILVNVTKYNLRHHNEKEAHKSHC